MKRYAVVTLRNALMGQQQVAAASTVSKIGNREVVGFGFNGTANYIDRVDIPMPAIRFKENTPDIVVSYSDASSSFRPSLWFIFYILCSSVSLL